MFSFKRFFFAGLSAALFFLPLLIQAEVALVKQLKGPDGSRGWLFSETWDDTSYGDEEKSWNSSYRTASTLDATYVVGWTVDFGIAAPSFDGFIARIDPAGGEVWSKSMREIMGAHAGSYGWKVDDIEVLQDTLYVCGHRQNGSLDVAFVAKITSNGSLVDYSLIEPVQSLEVPDYYSKANSLAVSIVDGQPVVVVAGEIQSLNMRVQERQVKAPLKTFPDLKIVCSYGDKHYSDAYVIQFDGSLKATWGTTFGYSSSNDSATAVEVDPTGSIFLALKLTDYDPSGTANLNNIDNERHVVIRGDTESGEATLMADGVYSGTNYISESSLSMLFRLDTSEAMKDKPVVSYFQPCHVGLFEDGLKPFALDPGPSTGSDSRIKDITYNDGSLYVAGEWQGVLRPAAHEQALVAGEDSPRSDGDFDVFVVKLDANTLNHSNWCLYQSSGSDYANELTVTSEGVFLAGSAERSLSHRNTMTADDDDTSTSIGGSSTAHLFWSKLSNTDLTHTWEVFPVESGAYTIPTHMRASGIASMGDTVLLTGYWTGGALSFGEPSNSNVKTLSQNMFGSLPVQAAFVGFLSGNGAWLNEVQVTIHSDYGVGLVAPHLGVDQVAAGRSIVASVPPEVYEDVNGNILDADNSELINASAVTRRICTGYQFKGSSINGTAHSVTFEATSDTELTFLWRTEHAIEIYSDIASVEGLSSTAAGDPFPVVQKHWVAENEQFTALIDGAATVSSENGTRWRSTGYLATGSVAEAAQVEDSSMAYWSSFQDRQQTPKITVAGPGSITWRWEKEYSIRVGVNTSVAKSAPVLTELLPDSETVTYTGTGEFWFKKGANITASSAATVNSGLSDLSLQGYIAAQGSITPPESAAAPASFTLTESSSITWDYGPTIYKETVTIGNVVNFSTVTGDSATRVNKTKAPATGSISSAPSGSAWDDMLAWDEVDQKLYPLRPGVFTAEFENTAAPKDAAKNIIIEVTAVWPSSADYDHIIEAPAVNLDPSGVDSTAFIQLAYSEGQAEVAGDLFSTLEAGRSVLVFSERAGSAATGNLQQETLSVKVVDSIHWTSSASFAQPVAIGTALTDVGHDREQIGHNGYVLTDYAPVNVHAYDRATLSGPIFPINELYPATDSWAIDSVADTTSGLIVHFPFNEVEGTVAKEKVSGSTAAFSNGSPAWASPGADLELDNGNYFIAETSVGSGLTNQATFSAWVRPESFNNWGSIMSKGTSKTTYLFGVWDDGSVVLAANLGAPESSGPHLSNTKLTAGEWAHIAALYDGATVRFYVNGELDSNEAAASFSFNALNEALNLGCDPAGDPEYFDGMIRDVRLYDRVLNASDVAALSKVTPANPGGLAVAWYRLQDSIRWPYKAVSYDPYWPSAAGRIVIASRLGSEGLDTAGTEQTLWSETTHSSPVVYQQGDPTAMGYNPNEEHALIAPSFIEASRSAAFALRNDLNVVSRDSNYTSEPYVLVQYVDQSDIETPEIKMQVFSIAEEDASVTDTRLPSFNQKYTYLYQNEAGQRLLPPYPLDLVIGGAGTPEETSGVNVDDRISYFEDKNDMPWVVSGDTDPEVDIEAAWYYPLRADFWHPTAALGEAISLGDLSLDTNAHNIDYNTVWPADVAVLKAGETLTFAGGEYATDRSGDVSPPQGLPQAVAWQSGELVFDDRNASLNPLVLSSQYLARLLPVLEVREVALPLAEVPDELTPASGDVTVDGLYWHFDALPASLKSRIYYDTNKQVLGLRGILNGYVIGDRDLLSTPGAQTILQPNVLTPAAEALVKSISTDGNWVAAVGLLADLSLDPNATGTRNAYMAGLDRDPDTDQLRPASANGPGLAVITNPKLQDPSTSDSLPEGYITIAENNDPELSTPVAMHVIKVSREKYRGSIAVLEPSNVFDEKLSLRHTADFGGDVEDLYFQWFYREEDGRDLNPPGIDKPTYGEPTASDWQVFAEGRGLSEIEMAGTGPVLIRDNLFYCRYGYSEDGATPTKWSAYAGAANSREPNPSSPSVDTDAAYVAQLASGWIKRVTNAVNAFDARFGDFQNNESPATYSSMLQQAGQRYEGPVAFNPDKDAIENVGLIELYQTVLNRAEAMTIETASGTTGVNAALLNAANRIAALYVLLGNEAYADALDPTIGYSTQSGQFGSLAPTIHAFENVTSNLLEEELTLLRGRDEVGARPSYNRLIWNFTNGSGEAAYVMNYDINDLTEDGFIDDVDARRLYPQGHGDAWGHYTMALSGYYRLAQIENFTWEPRSEKYNIDGIVLNVDYLDERAFAKAAAARAQCGAQLVDMVYRQKYTDNPAGQWQGYTDTNTDRAWGVFETAQRSGTAALFDWMMGNAVLQAEETDPLKTGIRKVDRSTVRELALIAANGQTIQSTLNMADGGLNPAGLDPNVIPFDIDPVRTDRSYDNPATHFEQIYERAISASRNALRTFEHANAIALQLRETEASTDQLRQDALDQDRSLRNQLIEVFGTPHDGMIGAGKAYPAGYNGPDLYLYLYVDQVSAGGDILDAFDGTVVETTIVPGLSQLADNSNPFEEGGASVDSALRDSVSNYFPADLELPTTATGEITLNLPRAASGYGLVAPDAWGARRSPGQIQAAIQDLVQSEWQLRMAVDQYESQADDFQNLLKKFELISGIAAHSIEISRSAAEDFGHWADVATSMYALGRPISLLAEKSAALTEGVAEAFPKVVGLSTDGTAPARGAVQLAGAISEMVAGASLIPIEVAQYRAEIEMDAASAELEQALVTQDRKIEIVELLFEINDLVNSESDALTEVINALESMRAASARVATTIEQGQALIEERLVFNQRVAATTTKHRYEDYTFRVFHNEALRKYRSSFDLATRYAYLAGKAYQYELNLPDNHAANASPILSSLLRERTLGEWDEGGEPVIGQSGVAEHLAILKANFDTLKGQLGFNNPTDEVTTFSLRRELERVGMSSRVNGDWRTALEGYRVPDLWNYEYESNGVNYGYVFRRFCRPFAAESGGAQPALVIPFSTEIAAGKNWFGKDLAGGDSSFNSTNFSTKIRSVGVRIDGYNNTTLSNTPQVYLVPVGSDKMFLPHSSRLESRSWNVVDQRIPAPLPISSSNLTDPDWQPYSGSSNGFFEDIRKFSSFRAYHDAGGWSDSEMLNNSRHVGRSVWNTQWVLIIPNASLLYDSGNTQAGIDTLIYGAPLPTYDQSTAGTTNRDGIGIQDIQILLDTYSISGN